MLSKAEWEEAVGWNATHEDGFKTADQTGSVGLGTNFFVDGAFLSDLVKLYKTVQVM